MEVGTIYDFRLKSPFISEMLRDRPRNANIKSWAIDRSVLVLMISSDLERRDARGQIHRANLRSYARTV